MIEISLDFQINVLALSAISDLEHYYFYNASVKLKKIIELLDEDIKQ